MCDGDDDVRLFVMLIPRNLKLVNLLRLRYIVVDKGVCLYFLFPLINEQLLGFADNEQWLVL